MNATEFYRRVAALALYDKFNSEVSTGFVLSKLLKEDLQTAREMVAFVRETLDRFYLVDGQLLEKVAEKDWYLHTADRQQYVSEKFLNGLTPERASSIFEAQHQLELRRIEKGVE